MKRENVIKEKQTLIENINNCDDFRKLEMTFTGLTLGWTVDDNNQEDYKELLKLTINRIKTLTIINGTEHPLSEVDIDNDEERIKISFMLSMVKSLGEMERKPQFDFNLN